MFEIFGTDGLARTGALGTAHGVFETPAFMPVGTQGSVKGVTPRELRELGAEIILSNTYHLHLRPGDERIRDLGGLHKFMNWSGPILTDSGGYQVFSLGKLRKITDSGVTFQSHLDGAPVSFTPERVVKIQENLGVDIMMVLDECLSYPSTEAETEKSLVRTLKWAELSKEARSRSECLMFGIVQGGMYKNLRERSAKETLAVGFDGYAVGGLSVGEPNELMLEFAEFTAGFLPPVRPRYLMGVGTPRDLVLAVGYGYDMFDCVIPTRSARFGRVYTKKGYFSLRNTANRSSSEPIEEYCDCYACKNFSRAYISHLVHAKEILALQLATLHNLRFYQRLMRDIRAAIRQSRFIEFQKEFLRSYETNEEESAIEDEESLESL